MEKSITSEHNSIKNSKMSSYQKGRHLWRKEQRSPLLTASCLQWTSFSFLEEPHCCCCIFLTAMVWGFCHKSNRKLAWESPTTTPTPYHILSPGKERKRGDKGNEEVQARETQPGEPDGHRPGNGSPRRQWELSPSDHLLRAGLGQMIPCFWVFLNKLSFLKTHYLPTTVLL